MSAGTTCIVKYLECVNGAVKCVEMNYGRLFLFVLFISVILNIVVPYSLLSS